MNTNRQLIEHYTKIEKYIQFRSEEVFFLQENWCSPLSSDEK